LLHKLITLLQTEFKPQDLGYVYFFLGIKVKPTFSKLGIVHGTLYSDLTWYRQIVGALQYLTFTRLDICYQSTKYVNFCMPLLRIIRLPLNVSCVTSKLQQPMVRTLLETLSWLFMVSQMLIGLTVLAIENTQVVILCTLVQETTHCCDVFYRSRIQSLGWWHC